MNADSPISACILARNEEQRIEEALRSLGGWTRQIILIDNESDDGTVTIARRYTDSILSGPRSANFDALRNLAIPVATGEWIFYLDADERVPAALGSLLTQLVTERGDEFEALVLPFKHYFCGRWMEHSGWWPGYTRPQLLKKGCFRYNERLHSGVQVDGRTRVFPANDPELAIVHHSYTDLHHYLEKLNRYTDGEAESLLADGASHDWQAQLAHFVHDWQQYYEHGRADLDGMHGFVLSFMSAFYRYASRAKVWDLRRQAGTLPADEPLPRDIPEMLRFMAEVAEKGAAPWLEARSPALPSTAPAASAPVPLLWYGPLLHSSGYGDEARQLVLALMEAEQPVAVAPANWGSEDPGIEPSVRASLEARVVPARQAAEICVSHLLPVLQEPSPYARINVARTMFETDRLPEPLVPRLNRFERIWVPSEFNRETFVRSGIEPEKITVIPGALDVEPFAADVAPWPLPGEDGAAVEGAPRPYRFLSVFDWSRHKGWDVLLEAFAREFGSEAADAGGAAPRGKQGADAVLYIKTWSSNNLSLDDIREQADAHLQARLGRGLDAFPNIRIWREIIPSSELPRLYRAVDAFVLPTRGEGWCRPLMEAMAVGLPTIATGWSGLTAFHDARVGYPVKYRLQRVPEAASAEIPIFAGHCWAEPDLADLRRQMRQLANDPAAGRRKGDAAQRRIRTRYSRAAVARILQEELTFCREKVTPVPTPVLTAAAPVHEGAPAATSRAAQPADRAPAVPFKPKARVLVRAPAEPFDFRKLLGRPLRVRWEGDQALLSSLARVNRELCLGLLAVGDVELSLVEDRIPWHTLTERDDPRFGELFARLNAPLSGPPDVTIRHHFPPNWQRPDEGRLIVIQPWEYGYLPGDWVAGSGQADEVWAYSRFVRDVYVRSGVPAEKVRVVPLGFDPDVFRPEGPRLDVARSFGREGASPDATRFLFVGGALDRKGADLLLQAYLRAFSRTDRVSLVVKDMGTRTFYRGATLAESLREAAVNPSVPEVIYLDQDLSEGELAALYRGAAAIVLPYRGEGFALSPLEGAACGLLPIVTAGGPTDDYLDDEIAIRLPASRRLTGGCHVGPADIGFDCVGDPWQLEPDLESLVSALRWVHANPGESHRRGAAAAEQLRDWSWRGAVAQARARLREVLVPTPALSAAPPQPWVANANGGAARGGGAKAARKRPSAAPRVPTPELSLCMIVRDEEPRIRQCLESIRPYVDEMVVVDTGSKDRTPEIAQACGARVYQFPWCEDFAAARNVSLEHARGRWLFWMDADDVISPDCGRGLREVIRRHPKLDAAFQVQVRIPPGPGEFSASLVDHVKLFPNRPELRFEHRIHEQILPAIRRAGLPVFPSGLFVTHANYDRSDAGQARKRERDFRLLQLDLQDRPEHPFVLFNLGMTYLYATHDYEVAAHYLRRSLDRSDPRDSIVRKAYAMLTQCRICQGDWQAAIQANEEGRTHYADDAELLFQAGQIYQQLCRWESARQCLERLIQGEDDAHFRSVDMGIRTFRARHELALLFRQMGDARHCVEILHQVVSAHPEYVPAGADLAETLALLGKCDEAERVLARLPGSEVPDVLRVRAILGKQRINGGSNRSVPGAPS